MKVNQDFEKCIKTVCVYCRDYKKWSSLKDKYKIIYDVYTIRKDVINFIKDLSLKDIKQEIKPFPITKVIRYKDYIDKYKYRHMIISQFYGDLTPETFKEKIKEMESLVKKEEEMHLLKGISKKILDGFYTFNIKNDIKILDELIIQAYTKQAFYGDLNKWLMNYKMNSFETVAYFTARLMYSLNTYGKTNEAFFTNNAEVKRGIRLPYSYLLPYKRAKGKIILLSAFTSTSQVEKKAEKFSGREHADKQYKTQLLFSVIYHIKNYYKNGWISNGVNIENVSNFKNEREVLYQPFSFYYVKDIQIDIKKHTGDIYLYTIGKVDILEESIKLGKSIEFNEKEVIMQVIN